MHSDKAGKQYWDDLWASRSVPDSLVPSCLRLNDPLNKRFHAFFARVFSGMEAQKMKLLEVGCADSSWLPYFASEFGFNVSGLDYSELGCQQERQIMLNVGVHGDIVCADLFSPPESMWNAFDIVVTIGVAEHFEDTGACVAALSKFLRPDGTMITIIPNLVGLIGHIQKRINRPIFDIHMPLDAEALATAHRLAGLEVLECNYFLSTNFGVCNLNGIEAGSIQWLVKKVILALLTRLSMSVWLIEDKAGMLRANKLTSPYINCVARNSAPERHPVAPKT